MLDYYSSVYGYWFKHLKFVEVEDEIKIFIIFKGKKKNDFNFFAMKKKKYVITN